MELKHFFKIPAKKIINLFLVILSQKRLNNLESLWIKKSMKTIQLSQKIFLVKHSFEIKKQPHLIRLKLKRKRPIRIWFKWI